MASRIEQNEAVAKAVRRIAKEQLEKAVEELDDEQVSVAETVHQVRKRCKKLRGLVRLIRPVFKRYKAENVALRDAAGLLSVVRDVQVHTETYDRVAEHFDQQVNQTAFESIRQELTRRREETVQDEIDLNRRLEAFRSEIVAAQQRVDDWTLRDKGYDAVRDGLAKTYARGRKAMKDCVDSDRAEVFHQWRKRVKYHWYHCRLLEGAWPAVLKVRQRQTHCLSEWLGDAHDMAVLADHIEARRTDYGEAADVDAFLGLLNQRRRELEGQGLLLGKRLFAESADAFAKRIGRYWKVWRA